MGRIKLLGSNAQIQEAIYNAFRNARNKLWTGIQTSAEVFTNPGLSDILANADDAGPILNRFGGQWMNLMDTQTASPAFVLPNGVVNVSEIIRLTGGNFGTVSSLLAHNWRTGVVGSGSASVTNGELILATGTTANSSVAVDSFRKAPFSAATFNLSHLAFAMPNPFNANVTRRFGVFEPNSSPINGMYFEFFGGTGSDVSCNLVTVKAGVEVDRFTEGQFNGGNTLVKDANIHVYENVYNAGTIFWFQDRKLIHRSSAPTTSAFATPDLRVGSQILNTGGNTTNNTLVSRGKAISRIGVNNAIPRFFRIISSGTFIIKNSSGRLKHVTINRKGAGSATIDIYNNTAGSGDIIASIDTQVVQGTVTYDCTFDIGLTLVVSGVNVGLTVSYE